MQMKKADRELDILQSEAGSSVKQTAQYAGVLLGGVFKNPHMKTCRNHEKARLALHVNWL